MQLLRRNHTIIAMILVALLCSVIQAACGEDMLETCFLQSPLLDASLTAEEKGRLTVTTDRSSAYFDERWIEYSYLGIDGISFSLTIDHGVPVIQDEQVFLASLRSFQTAAVDLMEAEAIARDYFGQFLETETDDPTYQAYLRHFGLECITPSDCFFKPSFSADDGDIAEWSFQVYPVLASEEIGGADALETPLAFLQWALICVDAQTGEITDFEADNCFCQWEGLFDEELIASIQEILRTETTDFSMYTFTNGDFVDEWKVLGEAESMIHEGVPMERLCPSFGHDEIVFKVFARNCLMEMNAFGRPPIISTMQVLHWYPGAVDYAQSNEPETLEMLVQIDAK